MPELDNFGILSSQEDFDKWFENLNFNITFATEAYKQIAKELKIDYKLRVQNFDVFMVFTHKYKINDNYQHDECGISIFDSKFILFESNRVSFRFVLEDDSYIDKIKEVVNMSKYAFNNQKTHVKNDNTTTNTQMFSDKIKKYFKSDYLMGIYAGVGICAGLFFIIFLITLVNNALGIS